MNTKKTLQFGRKTLEFGVSSATQKALKAKSGPSIAPQQLDPATGKYYLTPLAQALTTKKA